MKFLLCRRNLPLIILGTLLLSIFLVYHRITSETLRLRGLDTARAQFDQIQNYLFNKPDLLNTTIVYPKILAPILRTDTLSTSSSTDSVQLNQSISSGVSQTTLISHSFNVTSPQISSTPTVTTTLSTKGITTTQLKSLPSTELPEEIGKLFNPIVREDEKDGLRKVLRAFHESVKLHNVTYFMYAGTLLGSYRHHDYIPWDKDIDLLVDIVNKDVLKKYLESLKPEFDLNTKLGEVWRLSHKSAPLTVTRYHWPYADVFFYKQNETHLWASFVDEIKIKYEKKDILPLIERPFMGLMLPAPRNTSKILKVKFDLEKCKNNRFEARDLISKRKVLEIPCSDLRHKFPFVKRQQLNDSHVYEVAVSWTNNTWVLSNETYILPV